MQLWTVGHAYWKGLLFLRNMRSADRHELTHSHRIGHLKPHTFTLWSTPNERHTLKRIKCLIEVLFFTNSIHVTDHFTFALYSDPNKIYNSPHRGCLLSLLTYSTAFLRT